jgi:hypothetical protein
MIYNKYTLQKYCKVVGGAAEVKRLGKWLLLLVLVGWGRLVMAQTPAWQLALSGSNNQALNGRSIGLATAVDTSGNVFVTGSFTGTVAFGTTQLVSRTGYQDMFVAKWNAIAGHWAWATSGGGDYDDYGRSIAVANGNVYVAGSLQAPGVGQIAGTTLTSAGGDDAFLAKYTDLGNSYANGWATRAGGSEFDDANGVAVDGTNVYLTGFVNNQLTNANVAGVTLTGSGSFDMFLAKYVDTGTGYTNGWALGVGGTGGDQGMGIAARGGNVYVAGVFQNTATIAGTVLTSAGDDDAFVAKYVDTGTGYANGWAVRAGGSGADQAAAVAVAGTSVYVTGSFAGSAGVLLAGTTLTSAGFRDVFVAKYVDQGSTAADGWAVRGGGLYADDAFGLAVSGSDVYITGTSQLQGQPSFAGVPLVGNGTNAFVAKYVDQGTGAANGWAVSSTNGNANSNYSVAVAGNRVYTTLNTIGIVLLGLNPNLRGPIDAAVLTSLSTSTGAWLTTAWPIQKGASHVAAVTTDASGNVFVVGNYTGQIAFGNTALCSKNSQNIFLAKWSPTANTWLWATTVGDSYLDYAQDVAVSGSNVYITGTFRFGNDMQAAGTTLTSQGGQEIFIAKYVDNGTTFTDGWAIAVGGPDDDESHSLTVQGSSVYLAGTYTARFAGVVIAGTSLAAAGRTNAFVAKYIDQGSTVGNGWAATTAIGTGYAYGMGVAVHNASVYLVGHATGGTVQVAGTNLPSQGGMDVFLAKYVDQGLSYTNGWAVRGGSNGEDYSAHVAVHDSSVYVSGHAPSTATFAGTTLEGSGNADVFLAKYVDQGTSVADGWALSAGGIGDDVSGGLAVSGAEVYLTGNFPNNTSPVVAGRLLAGTGLIDFFVGKYVDEGPAVSNGWAISAGSTSDDSAPALAVAGGRVYVAGNLGARTSFSSLPAVGAVFGLNFLAGLTDTAPTLVAAVPGSAAVGSTISLTGHHLAGTTRLTFAGGALVTTGFVVNAAGTLITGVVVPAGTITGPLTATTPSGLTNAIIFTVPGSRPTLTRISPDTAPLGAVLSLAGYALHGATAVTFAGSGSNVVSAGLVVNATGTLITGVVVPSGAQTGPLTVTTAFGTSNALTFTVAAPVLTGLTPSYGGPGSVLTIVGRGLAGTTAITFTGSSSNVVSTGFVVNAAGTQITGVVVPNGAQTGPLTVTATGGTSNGVLFTLLLAPIISSFSPVSGPPGTAITVRGRYFTGATAVLLDGVAMGTPYVPNDSTLSFVARNDPSSGLITVVGRLGTVSTITGFCVGYPAVVPAVQRCGPGTLTLTATGAPAAGTYVWYDQAAGGPALPGTAGASLLLPNLAATITFYVAIRTGTGNTACDGPRTAVVATIHALPTLNIIAGGSTTICQGRSVTLTASGSNNYQWSTGATTASIVVSTAGSYTVSGASIAGCSATSAATTVAVEPLPAAPTISQGPVGTLTSSAATSNQWYLNGTAIVGAIGATYMVPSTAQNGRYTVVTTSSAGCVSPASAPATVTLTGVATALPLTKVQLVPNPAHGICTVHVPIEAGSTVSLLLLDALGRTVRSYPVATSAKASQQEINLTGVAAGVYALRLTVGGTTAVQRLVVE